MLFPKIVWRSIKPLFLNYQLYPGLENVSIYCPERGNPPSKLLSAFTVSSGTPPDCSWQCAACRQHVDPGVAHVPGSLHRSAARLGSQLAAFAQAPRKGAWSAVQDAKQNVEHGMRIQRSPNSDPWFELFKKNSDA